MMRPFYEGKDIFIYSLDSVTEINLTYDFKMIKQTINLEHDPYASYFSNICCKCVCVIVRDWT